MLLSLEFVRLQITQDVIPNILTGNAKTLNSSTKNDLLTETHMTNYQYMWVIIDETLSQQLIPLVLP
jgi:hypothetical protein